MKTLFKRLFEHNDATAIKQFISDQEQSVTTYIKTCLIKERISCFHHGKNRRFLDIDPRNPIETWFESIDPSTLNNLILLRVPSDPEDMNFMFPFQLQITNHQMSSVLVLKAFITNPGKNHFVTFIRLNTGYYFIRINDDIVGLEKTESYSEMPSKRIALYLVIKQERTSHFY